MTHDPRHGERGVALITALLSTLILLGLGLALLSVVDVQATESANERTRDRSFNLSEGVLTSQAFVLGRSWPERPLNGIPVAPACSAPGAGITDVVGAVTPTSAAVARVRSNINSTYAGDAAYTGATWQVNVCDDDEPSTVWSPALLLKPNRDENGNNKVWVRAQSTVAGKERIVVGLVRVRRTPALNPRYALTAGGLTDDLGGSINTLSEGVLGGVVGDLLNTKATVAEDQTNPPPNPPFPPNGKTGLRCGATDISLTGGVGTCVAGTLGAAGGLPVAKALITGGKVENLPGDTATSPENIGRLRAQAKAAGTYTAVSVGSAPTAPPPPPTLSPTDTAPAGTIPLCTLTGSPGSDSVVFIERVGNGAQTPGVPGGAGDQYCRLDVSTVKTYRAIIVASGRLVIRGNGNVTADTNQAENTFKGVVYGLNQQRLSLADGGQNLGDVAAPGREVVRIDQGAHVRGGVNADGRSGKVSVFPPPIAINTNTLVDALIPCALPILGCPVRALLKALTGGVSAIVDGILGQGVNPLAVINALLDQARPQRVNYGSAITSDVNAIQALTVYGASGVLPGSFKDLAGR